MPWSKYSCFMLVQTLPFPSLSPPLPKTKEGSRESWRADTSGACRHFCRSLFSSRQLCARDTARPWSGGGGAASKAGAGLSFNKRPFFFFFLNKTSKLFFVSVLLVPSLSLCTLPVQTTNLRRNLKNQKTPPSWQVWESFPSG